MVVSESGLHRHTAPPLEELPTLFQLERSLLHGIRSLASQVDAQSPPWIDQFATWLQQQPSLSGSSRSPERWHQLQDALVLYWNNFAAGPIDNSYRQQRQRIGAMHAESELPLLWFMAGLSAMHKQLHQVARQSGGGPRDTDELMHSVAALLHLDVSLILHGWVERRDALLIERGEWVQSQAAPISQAWPGLLLLSLVGEVDAARADELLPSVLEAVQSCRARRCVLDVAGLAEIDDTATRGLLSLARGCRLMGCALTLCGLRDHCSPSLANAISSGELTHYPTLPDAFQEIVADITKSQKA